MKVSRRANSRRRHYRRMHRTGGLNLVSLMDIFTILVFFLMVNSSDVKVMQNKAEVPLPESSAEKPAEELLTVQLVGDVLLVEGREVARLQAGDPANEGIAGLAEELAYRRDRRGEVPEAGFEITILADRHTDYRVLRRIMQTCVDEEFRQVRLAVEAITDGDSNG